MKKITVLLAEDHGIVREGLRTLLELSEEFAVVGEASNGREAVRMACQMQPDVIVMDIAMSGLNGFEATRQILLSTPQVKVLVLSAHSDDEYIRRMLEIGAAGYLAKQNSGEVLVHAIKEVAAGKPYFSPSVAKRLRHAKEKARLAGAPHPNPAPTLTKREAEVLQLVAEGLANKQMAAELGISIKTIEKHRQQLMNKLDIHDTAGLTRHAIATGVIESSIQETTANR
ncbi:response regulator transcription factor [Pelagicoccus sp. SDUM812005]|uniref:response regulator transcription factor n=1 Tax=Pelagicoccus sp. SDUM812005 TaxID=3041257 RepID=UPI00280CF64F|nr:response regulator transcription factor [Pelagicoccus sp. SDUM812005]MDQ8180774.1 response regulator transcription factor [Pelagicoccus sp. SDUM812005]